MSIADVRIYERLMKLSTGVFPVLKYLDSRVKWANISSLPCDSPQLAAGGFI